MINIIALKTLQCKNTHVGSFSSDYMHCFVLMWIF